MEKHLDITKPCYSEQILLVTWYFVILRFHCTIHYWGFLNLHWSLFQSILKGLVERVIKLLMILGQILPSFRRQKKRNLLVYQPSLFLGTRSLAEYCCFLLLEFWVELFLPDSSPPILIPLTHLRFHF